MTIFLSHVTVVTHNYHQHDRTKSSSCGEELLHSNQRQQTVKTSWRKSVRPADEEAQWAKRCLPFSSLPLPLTLCSILSIYSLSNETNRAFLIIRVPVCRLATLRKSPALLGTNRRETVHFHFLSAQLVDSYWYHGQKKRKRKRNISSS